MKKLLCRFCLVLALALTLFSSASGASAPTFLSSSQTAGLRAEMMLSAADTPDVDRYLPDVAYNSKTKESLVVWHRDDAPSYLIEGRLMTRNGPKGSGPIILQQSPVAIKQPAVVYNAKENQYLLAWMKNVSGNGNDFDIYAKILAADLVTVRSEFEVIHWVDRSFWTPRVAWNSKWDEYIVVWTARSISTGLTTDIADATLMANGDIRRTANLITTVGVPHQADVAYNAALDEYYAVWRVMGEGVSYGQVYGVRVNANNGTPLDSSPTHIQPSTNDQRFPRVATNNTMRWMVVWEELISGFPSNWYVMGQELDSHGAQVHEPQLISFAKTSTVESMPTITALEGDGSAYVVTYQASTPTGTGLYLSFNDNYQNTITWLGYVNWVDTFAFTDSGFWDDTRPETAISAGDGVVVVYQGDSAGDPTVRQHIFARTWSPYIGYLPAVVK